MALKANIQGIVYDYPEVFEVGREQIRQFARSVKAEDPASFNEEAAASLGHDGLVAGPTFSSIFAVQVQAAFFRDVDLGMETMQIIQVDQRFVYHKPVTVGDRLHARMEIQSVDVRFGADIVVTRNVCTNDDGEVVMEGFTTLMGHEGDNSVSVKWDPESGQVIRKAAGE
ncbi:(3R)-hydroxyacyl-ACP dehydratase subunit HadC [Mycobacterium sp. NPDC003449]